MPKRTKKLLIYLDQNFISELAKADINNKVKPVWKDVYRLLVEGFLDEKLVVPQSWFHDIETSLAPVLKERIVSYQNFLGQIDLYDAEHIENVQTGRFLQRFLGKENVDPFETQVAFRDPPDRRVKQYNITVNSDLSHWGFHRQRVETAAEMERIRTDIISKNVRYKDQLEKELNAHSDNFLGKAVFFQHLCQNPTQDLVAFSKDAAFRTIPVVSISARLWSSVFTKFPRRQIQTGDATDIAVMSTYLPYMDVIGTDALMATLLAQLGIDREHDVRVFNAKTKNLQAFCDFLENYLKGALPANRPSISVFVLPNESVKEKAFKLFFDLGAAAKQFSTEEYAELYAFDDGKMPRYTVSDIPVPFYGLQEVNPIKIEPGTTMKEILHVCRERCKSHHFVLINEYCPIAKTFLIEALMRAEAGIDGGDGYRIYPGKA
jgi:hypothetical protein